MSFLQDTDGKRSTMRLMSFISLFVSIGFGVLTLVHPGAGIEGLYITFGFLVAAFAPKALQKMVEKLP